MGANLLARNALSLSMATMYAEKFRVAFFALVFATALPAAALADQGDCSQPVTNGANASATDCLFILQVAVGVSQCSPACICAPKGTLPATATDALLCLNAAVGSPVTTDCPCEGGGTTTTSTTTTTLGDGSYRAESIAYLNSLVIPPVDTSQSEVIVDCCKDFGEISRDFIEEGTNNLDNIVAALIALLADLSGDPIGPQVDDAIADGDIVPASRPSRR